MAEMETLRLEILANYFEEDRDETLPCLKTSRERDVRDREHNPAHLTIYGMAAWENRLRKLRLVNGKIDWRFTALQYKKRQFVQLLHRQSLSRLQNESI